MHIRRLLLAGTFGCLAFLAALLSLGARAGVASAADGAAPNAQAGSFITVTVRAGDSLAKYARLYGVSGASLVAVNPLRDPNLIFPGQVITIPVVRSDVPSLTTPFFYVVQAGDTLLEVGRRFEMDPSVIANANGITNDVIVAGQTLLIPAGPHLHITQAGETLRAIAAAHGTTVSFLLTGNQLQNPDLIFPGQPIFIPIMYNAQPLGLHGVVAPPPATPGPTATAGPSPTPAPTATHTPIAPGSENWIRVTVHSGESFVTYVSRYGVNRARLRQANPQILDPNLIFPGDVVNIPVPVSFTPSRTTPFFYVVQGGESAASIAAKFEMTADTLTRANPGANFAEGSTILVPAGPHLYTVRQGDTLGGIATRYGTTVDFLLTANTVPNPNALAPGQQILVPVQLDKNPVPYD